MHCTHCPKLLRSRLAAFGTSWAAQGDQRRLIRSVFYDVPEPAHHGLLPGGR